MVSSTRFHVLLIIFSFAMTFSAGLASLSAFAIQNKNNIAQTSTTTAGSNTTSVAQAIVSNKLGVWFNAFTGVPVSWEWKGLEIDTQHKVVGGAVSIQGGSSEKVQFMTLLGAEGSASEHRVFEEVYEE